jgi:hypothetical protein
MFEKNGDETFPFSKTKQKLTQKMLDTSRLLFSFLSIQKQNNSFLEIHKLENLTKLPES